MLGTLLFFGEETATTRALLDRLHRSYFSYHLAATPSEVQRVLKSNIPDALIVQAGFGNFDSLELCGKLRRHPIAGGLPIVLIQENLAKADWGRALISGIDDILSLDPASLAGTTHRIKFLVREYAEISALQSRVSKYCPLGLRELDVEFDHSVQVYSLGKDSNLCFLESIEGSEFSRPKNTILIPSSLTQELDLVKFRNGPGGDRLNILCEARSGGEASRHLLELGADDLFENSNTGCINLRVSALKYRKARKAKLVSKLDAQIAYAHFDPLTKLHNRRSGMELAADALATTKKSAGQFCAIVIDLDRFKSINDQFGHAVGDRILLKTAKRLKQHIRDADILFRFGGDEFVLILPKTNLGTANRIAKRLKSTFKQPVLEFNKKFDVGISLGVADLADSSESLEELLNRADQNMYLDKRAPKQLNFFAQVESVSTA